jgi:hypothetical protein
LDHPDGDPDRTCSVTAKVYATVQQVWEVLTDYERWPGVVPGVVRALSPTSFLSCASCAAPHPAQSRAERLRLQGGPGRTVVCFRGCESLPLWRVAGAATLEFAEQLPRGGPAARGLTFRELEGTSPAGRLAGRWTVRAVGGAEVAGAGAPRCELTYSASLLPRDQAHPLPATTSRRLLAETAGDALRCVARRAEQRARAASGPSWLEAAGRGSAGQPGAVSPAAAAAVNDNADGFGPRELWGAAALPLDQWAQPNFLGVQAVPLPPLPPRASLPPPAQPASPPISELPDGDGGGRDASSAPLQEVHLRRLDTDGALHRRAVATVRVAAPLAFAWAALTEWHIHGSFLPGVCSARVLQESVAQPGRARVRYLVARALPYLALHGVCTLDVLAQGTPGASAAGSREVQFRAVLPDAPPGCSALVLRGKWLLAHDLGAEEEEEEEEELASGAAVGAAAAAQGDAAPAPSASAAAAAAAAVSSLLKLAVEARCSLSPGSPATDTPLGERAVYEHLPALLTSLRSRAEALWAASMQPELSGNGDGASPSELALQAARAARARAASAPLALSPAVSTLTSSPQMLRAALLAAGFGADDVMPRRTTLRTSTHPSAPALEAAISALGGFALVAQSLGWSLTYRAKKPRGYWDRLENVKAEMSDFIKANACEPGVMPTRQALVAAGRSDLAKLPEKWGGAASLAAELGLRPASAGRRASWRLRVWNEHVRTTAQTTGLSGRELFEVASGTYAPPAQPQGPEEGEEPGEEAQETSSLWKTDWRRPPQQTDGQEQTGATAADPSAA